MTVKERIREMAIILLWGLACWLFFQFFYSYHFFYQEQNQLFLFSGDYLATYFQKPAWAACMAGDFLTQFYYYRFAGPVILTLTLLVMGDLLCRSFRQIHNGTWAFGASIVLMTLEAYFFLHHDHRLSSAMAIIIGSILFLFYALASRRMHPVVRVIFGMSLGIVAYSTAGYGWMVFALFAIAYDMVKKKRLKWWGCFLILGMIVIAITTTNRSYLLNTTANLTYPGIAHYAKPDFELEKTLAVDNEYYFGNWGKVEQLVEGEEHPNEVQLFFYNLVKAQKGELPDYLLKFSPNQLGTFYAIGPSTPKLIINNMNELYWALGDMTLTERAAMMTNVFAPDNRNIRMMKRLADCNLVSGDTLAANKYLNILQQTWVYRNWASLIKALGEPHQGPRPQDMALLHREETIREPRRHHPPERQPPYGDDGIARQQSPQHRCPRLHSLQHPVAERHRQLQARLRPLLHRHRHAPAEAPLSASPDDMACRHKRP